MGRKYIGQVNNQNFVYPNYEMTEYDVEIVHDINNNCISGTVTNFSATTVSNSSITFSFNGTFNYNGSDPFKRDIATPIITTPYLSVHCQVPGQTYMNTWRVVETRSTSYTGTTIPTTGSWTGDTFTITPANFGLSTFSGGTYYFEFRFIAEKCLYKICTTLNINLGTPTPTPTATITPTPTSTPTGCTSDNVCMAINVTGATAGPEGQTGQIEYNNCYGVLTGEIFTTNGTRYRCVQYVGGLPQIFSYSNIEPPTIYGGNCNTFSCPTGVTTPTPTPTPTATSTPTPTPTSTPSNPCYCFPIVVTGTTGEGTIASIEYNNCNGELIARSFTVGPGTYYLCIQVISSVVQYFAASGIDESYLTLSYITGDCRAGYDCSGYVPASTPTPTPTPTATGVPATATPTPTPTATGVPATATPTPTATSTPTPTPTATEQPFYTYYIGQSNASRVDACSNFDSEPQTEVYAATDVPGSVTRFYTDTSLITPFIGSGSYYAWRLGFSGSATNGGTVSSGGFVSDIGLC